MDNPAPEPPFPPTEEFIPVGPLTLSGLRRAAQECRGCALYANATQAVTGEGPTPARVMVIGEQPGDSEDKQGRPFVGPAGRLFDKALAEAGLDRRGLFVTNAVKHFSFEPRGKARIHKRPKDSEVRACNPWLEAELELVKPELVLLLGATAGLAVMGPAFRVTRDRGRALTSPLAPVVFATAHPSSVLRAPDEAARREAYRALVADLRIVAEALRSRHARRRGPAVAATRQRQLSLLP
jgi:uracil-DNA glycosylase